MRNGLKRYLLDTNAIVALLQGNQSILNVLSDATWIGISIIAKLEFLAFTGLSEEDQKVFNAFEQRVNVQGVSSHQTQLVETIISLRSTQKLKMPDAIIAATAIICQADLLTADHQLLKVKAIPTLSW